MRPEIRRLARAHLLEETLPRWNRTRGGEEVAAYLRLDARPATAGLRRAHDAGTPVAGVRVFGPHLGGRGHGRRSGALPGRALAVMIA